MSTTLRQSPTPPLHVFFAFSLNIYKFKKKEWLASYNFYRLIICNVYMVIFVKWRSDVDFQVEN